MVTAPPPRAPHGTSEDRTGPVTVDTLRSWGYAVAPAVVVADGPPVGRALAAALAVAPVLVITTGGTGVSPTDATPEQTKPHLERELPGIPELVRSVGIAGGQPLAAISRGLAGVTGGTVIVNLPGSRGGVRDALSVLRPVLEHVVEQLAGADHEPPS